jgi:hypothetical protein
MSLAEQPDVDYPDREPGADADERAVRHRRAALDAARDLDAADAAVMHAILALEARVEELTCFVARLG